jgi:hypothetical protein
VLSTLLRIFQCIHDWLKTETAQGLLSQGDQSYFLQFLTPRHRSPDGAEAITLDRLDAAIEALKIICGEAPPQPQAPTYKADAIDGPIAALLREALLAAQRPTPDRRRQLLRDHADSFGQFLSRISTDLKQPIFLLLDEFYRLSLDDQSFIIGSI